MSYVHLKLTVLYCNYTPLPFLVTPLMFKVPSNYIPRIIEKTTALKQQINMCREIVQVPSEDKYLFQFSEKGKQCDIQQLKENLLKLIEKFKLTAITRHFHFVSLHSCSRCLPTTFLGLSFIDFIS
jgi:hypothetical protein